MADGNKVVTKVLDEVIENVIMCALNQTEEDLHKENTAEEQVTEVKQPQKKSLWTCPICFCVIQHRQNVQRHQAICSSVKAIPKEKPKQEKSLTTVFKCDYCEAHFSLQKSLIAHEKRNHIEQFCIKNKDTLFNCIQCNFKTTAEKYLRIHVRKFHMEKGNFNCETCNKQYANKDSLRVHEKTHHLSIQFNFVCEVCGCVVVTSDPGGEHTCVANSHTPVVFNNNNQVFPTPSPDMKIAKLDTLQLVTGRMEQNDHNLRVWDDSQFLPEEFDKNQDYQNHSQFGNGDDWQYEFGVAPLAMQEQVNNRVMVLETGHSQAGPSHRVSEDWKISEIDGQVFFDL